MIYGIQDGVISDWKFQETIRTSVCNHRVDARLGKVIFELDGGAHHVFRDRHEHDRLVDSEYRIMGYRVVREPDVEGLFLRALQIIERYRSTKT